MMKLKEIIFLCCALACTQAFSKPHKAKLNKNKLSECASINGPNLIKYDAGYTFHNTFNNRGDRPIYLNRWKVNFINPEFLSAPKEEFAFTSTLAEHDYAVPPHTSMRYLKSGGAYKTEKMGDEDSDFDFAIIYKIYYDYSNTPDDKSDDELRVDCQTFKVGKENKRAEVLDSTAKNGALSQSGVFIGVDGSVRSTPTACEGDNRSDCFYEFKSKEDCLANIDEKQKSFCDLVD